MPHFVDIATNNFQLLPLVGGQTAANAALEQGSPLVYATTQPVNGNLLTNPGFETGPDRLDRQRPGRRGNRRDRRRLPARL